MKIAIVGPGIMSIPPTGWGAVEILIWDYYNELKNKNIDVSIINKIRNNSMEQSIISSSYCQELIQEINVNNYDVVHIHYDCLFFIAPHLNCKQVALTSHYPYIDQISKHLNDGYSKIFQFMLENVNIYINMMLADKDLNLLKQLSKGANKIHKLENGISCNNFLFQDIPKYGNKTIYLGKISDRKGQNKYNELKDIQIVGPGGNHLSNWIGLWSRKEVYNNLTEYGNLLLLSKGEADPLVVKEALICGLGVVLNETSSKNLENKEFITIIPDEYMEDLEYIQNAIEKNRIQSLKSRIKIREYAIERFGWNNLIQNYIKTIDSYL